MPVLFHAFSDRTPAAAKQALHEDFLKADRLFLQLAFAHWLMVSTVTAMPTGTYLFGIITGGLTTALVSLAYVFFRGTVVCRMMMGASLMLFSAIMIQQGLGRIEMHFHIFVALAFLPRYRDPIPLLTAAVVGALHHLTLNFCQQAGWTVAGMPVQLFDYGTGLDIVFLHAAFVVVEATVLMLIIVDNARSFCESASIVQAMLRVSQTQSFQERIPLQEHSEHSPVRYYNQLMDTISQLFGQVQQIVSALQAGNLRQRIPVDGQGDVRNVEEALNQTMRYMEQLVGNINEIMQGLQQGDFTGRVHVSSQGDFQTMSEGMNQTVGTLQRLVGQMTDSAQVQASTVEDVSVAVTQASRRVEDNAKHARQAAEWMQQAVHSTETNVQRIEKIYEAMNRIEEHVAQVQEIAKQTTLLGFNASVEAARAGVHGKGFAIVAQEVNKLAGQSKVTAQHIQHIAQESLGLAQSAARELQKYAPEIAKTAQTVAEIYEFSAEQNAALKRIRQEMDELSEAAQRSVQSLPNGKASLRLPN